jgi:hypothetical protein
MRDPSHSFMTFNHLKNHTGAFPITNGWSWKSGKNYGAPAPQWTPATAGTPSLAVSPLKHHPPRCETVDIRRGAHLVAITTKCAGSQIVGNNKKHVRDRLGGDEVAAKKRQKHSEGEDGFHAVGASGLTHF